MNDPRELGKTQANSDAGGVGAGMDVACIFKSITGQGCLIPAPGQETLPARGRRAGFGEGAGSPWGP